MEVTCVFNIATRVINSLGGCFGPAGDHVQVSRVTISWWLTGERE